MNDENNLNHNCPIESFSTTNNDVGKNSTNGSEAFYLENNLYNTFCNSFIEEEDANATEN